MGKEGESGKKEGGAKKFFVQRLIFFWPGVFFILAKVHEKRSFYALILWQ